MAARVSVIMNSYRDDPSHLRAAIKSYLQQQGVDTHLVLSTVADDLAVTVAEEFDVDLFVSDAPGIFTQLNAAISKVDGDFYVYASGNDVALPTKLADEVEMIEGHRVCYSAFHHADAQLRITKTARFHAYDHSQHLRGNFVSDLSLVTVDTLQEFTPFRVEYATHAYWDMWLRIAEKYGAGAFVYNDKPEWVYRVMPSSRHIRKKTDAKLRAYDERGRTKMLRDHAVRT